MKQYDPHWPFPQFDEKGQQLLPPPVPKNEWLKTAEEALL
jgi:hypothetical protein